MVDYEGYHSLHVGSVKKNRGQIWKKKGNKMECQKLEDLEAFAKNLMGFPQGAKMEILEERR